MGSKHNISTISIIVSLTPNIQKNTKKKSHTNQNRNVIVMMYQEGND